MRRVRLAVVTDIHHGPDEKTKRGSAALGLLATVLAATDDAEVDALIDLGDRISDRDHAADLELAQTVGRCFGTLSVPRQHVCGNHDRGNLSAEENAAALGIVLGSRSVEIGGLRCVFWEPEVRTTKRCGPHLADGDLDWLAGTLAGTDQPTLLFSHVPLSGQAMIGNIWFEHDPAGAAYREQVSIRAVLAAARCPLAAFAGHVHWNSFCVVDGIPHLTLQSLTETFTTAPEPSGCYGLLEVGGGMLQWTVRGLDALSLSLPWPCRRS